MPLPVQPLPVVQNWDCRACGSCCREYRVPVTDEERQRILGQGWEQDPDLGDLPLFRVSGPWWRRRYHLNQRGDGRCIFLSDAGRCRIHERHGAAAKPLACQLFPFVLVPAGDHWRVSLRFACPSVAGSKGRPLAVHDAEVARYAHETARRQGLDRASLPPPPLGPGQRVGWPDLLRFVAVLERLLRDPADRLELRLRKCLALVKLCRQARFDKVQGERLDELLALLTTGLAHDVPIDPAGVSPPSWMGRLLFRQAAALYVRQDHGPERGGAAAHRLFPLRAAAAFLRGQGPVPRLHARLPATTFERLEEPAGPLPAAAEQVLERYYAIKVSSLQFCGPTNFGMPFWEGFESLALTLPVVLWLTRAFAGQPPVEAVTDAVRIVDNPFGYSPILGLRRQRLALRLLARGGELERLIAWYSR